MSFMAPEVRRDPFPVYARMRQASPIVFNPAAEGWAVFRHEDVRTVLFDRERFSSDFFAHAPGSAITRRLGQSMVFSDPPRHKRLRDLVSSVFTPASIAEMEPWIRQTAARLANQDGAVFPEPDRFDIRRNHGAHLAFGTGIHFCLGATLARLEAICALEALLERTTGIELATGEPLSPCGGGVMVHGVERLPVRVTARR